jgi:hypothetical protein
MIDAGICDAENKPAFRSFYLLSNGFIVHIVQVRAIEPESPEERRCFSKI